MVPGEKRRLIWVSWGSKTQLTLGQGCHLVWQTQQTTGICFILMFLLRQCEICYFFPHGPVLCSAQMFRKRIPAPAPGWRWPGLSYNILRSYRSAVMWHSFCPLCSSTHSSPASISASPFEVLELKERQHGTQYLSGKSVFNGKVPGASLFRSILWINEHSFAGLQEAGAPQHPSCRINKWTVDFSGVSVCYF